MHRYQVQDPKSSQNNYKRDSSPQTFTEILKAQNQNIPQLKLAANNPKSSSPLSMKPMSKQPQQPLDSPKPLIQMPKALVTNSNTRNFFTPIQQKCQSKENWENIGEFEEGLDDLSESDNPTITNQVPESSQPYTFVEKIIQRQRDNNSKQSDGMIRKKINRSLSANRFNFSKTNDDASTMEKSFNSRFSHFNNTTFNCFTQQQHEKDNSIATTEKVGSYCSNDSFQKDKEAARTNLNLSKIEPPKITANMKQEVKKRTEFHKFFTTIGSQLYNKKQNRKTLENNVKMLENRVKKLQKEDQNLQRKIQSTQNETKKLIVFKRKQNKEENEINNFKQEEQRKAEQRQQMIQDLRQKTQITLKRKSDANVQYKSKLANEVKQELREQFDYRDRLMKKLQDRNAANAKQGFENLQQVKRKKNEFEFSKKNDCDLSSQMTIDHEEKKTFDLTKKLRTLSNMEELLINKIQNTMKVATTFNENKRKIQNGIIVV